MTQSQIDRVKVDQMFDTLRNLRNNPGEFFPAQMRAKNALAAWQAKYPVEAKAELDAIEATRKEREIEKAARPKLTDEQMWQ